MDCPSKVFRIVGSFSPPRFRRRSWGILPFECKFCSWGTCVLPFQRKRGLALQLPKGPGASRLPSLRGKERGQGFHLAPLSLFRATHASANVSRSLIFNFHPSKSADGFHHGQRLSNIQRSSGAVAETERESSSVFPFQNDFVVDYFVWSKNLPQHRHDILVELARRFCRRRRQSIVISEEASQLRSCSTS